MRRTKDQQVKEVVVGMALGVLAHGVVAVTSSKTDLESAFNHAWRRWSLASVFPSIAGHNPGNLLWIGLGKSEGRRVACAAWDAEDWTVPYIRFSGWTVDEALEHHESHEVAAEDWVELGGLFVERLGDNKVRRG